MAFKTTDITGQRNGKLLAIEFSHKEEKQYMWKFSCDCGNTVIFNKCKFKYKKSCGCLQKESARKLCLERNFKHGKSPRGQMSKVYIAYHCMINRVFNPRRDSDKRNYDGRGITVCDEWLGEDGFEKFYACVGDPPPKETGVRWSLGRIDNSLDYSPDNVRWENDYQQARNKSMQYNNTSGHTGVYLKSRKGHDYWIADWREISGERKRVTRYFSVLKYGEREAFNLACKTRELAIEKLNSQGAGYAENHGKPK